MLLMHVVPLLHVFITLMVLPTRHANVMQGNSMVMATTVRTLISVALGGSAAALCKANKELCECWV